MTTGRAGRRALFGALFLLSGAAGLVYEQLWIRELQHFFGSTIHSITTVVAAYMGGLGLGAWVLGRRADRHPNPARLYGVLELLIGGFGMLSPLIFEGVGAGYLAFARSAAPGLWLATAVKFLVAFAVLLIPTFLMGATLPILTRAFTGPTTRELRRELALFYGLNTVGGVVGCLLAGFWLVERVGIVTALFMTGVLNLALGAAAIAATGQARHVEESEASGEATAEHAAAPPVEDDPAARRLAMWLIGLTALASLLYEIAWTRVLVLVVGSSTYAFTTILACFLLGIGLGSLVAIGRGRPARELLKKAAIIQGVIAVLASLLFPFFRALPVYIVATLQVSFLTATQLVALHSIALALVVIPPAIGMGLVFPLLAEAAAERTGGAGSQTGRAYFANTAGSILGSIVTGFVLIHTIGSERTLALGILLNVALAAWVTWHLQKERGGGWSIPEGERIGVLLGALALIIAFLTPSWSTRLLDRGPAVYGRDRFSRGDLDHYLRGYGAEQLSFDEGWNAAISVWRNGNAVWLKSNGKADASSVADMDTQVLVGLLPALAHPDPRRVFLVGLGSGVTARAIADVRGVERLDVVEIEAAVVDATRFFHEVNGNILADRRVRVVMDDARSALQLADTPYDVIVSEPSNPWIAGVSALFTRDYFRIVQSRLTPDGVFAQWVQMYRVPISVVSVVVANLRAVFPHVEIWYANPADLVLVAANRPIRWPGARIAAHFDTGTAAGRTMRDWLEAERPSQLLGHFLMGERGTASLAAQAGFVHTDRHPALEFVAARGLLASTSNVQVFDSLLGIRRAAGDTLPLLDGDWRLGPGEWEAAFAHVLPPVNPLALDYARRAIAAAPRDPSRKALMGRLYVNRDEFRAALPYLAEAVRDAPRDPTALLLHGIASSATGSLAEGRALLARARAAGGDSVYAMSLLDEQAEGLQDYVTAADLTTRAVRALRPTKAAPFPGALSTAVRRMAWEAPPEIAAPVLAAVREARPGWDLGYHGGAVVFLRWGADHCGEAERVAAELGRFGWTDREIVGLMRGCLRM